MLDNDLLALITTRLNAAVTAAGWMYMPPTGGTPAPYPVLQKQQPTQEGIPYSPTIFFEKLFDQVYGFADVSHSFDEGTSTMTETETQLIATTIQISALVIQEPANLSLPTASDAANYVRSFFMARSNLRLLWAQNVNVLRVTQVANPYIEDDRHRNEATPSFDVVVTHQRTFASNIDYATSMIGEDIIVEL